jgi:deoxyribodipyrimidine photo-lyase
MDGDPASNTLSWRWVAGLHTRGKHYLARASNIAEYTGGRFDPSGELDERAAPLEEDAPTPAMPLPPADLAPEGPAALLLTEEDGLAETWALGRARVVALGAFAAPAARSPLGLGAMAEHFAVGAIDDALARAAGHFAAVPARFADAAAVAAWAKGAGAEAVVTAYAPVGPAAERLASLAPVLAAEGVRLIRLRRAWDEAIWPHATRGFFQVKDRIPAILRTLGEGGG